jgi:hypothetical protein
MGQVIGIIVGVIVVLVVGLVVLVRVSEASAKKRALEAEAARGRELGTWTVYYDVKGLRIGLVATFPEAELLRFLLFRVHDLFDYNRGLEGERRALADALRAATRGEGERWQLAFPPAPGECYHAYDSPNGTLLKFFDGSLFEHAVSQPRFLGGDAIAKAKGLVGECVAIIAHLRRDPATGAKVSKAVDMLVERELSGAASGSGAAFWTAPNDALRAAG